MTPTVWRDAIRDAEELTGTQKLVALLMSTYMNKDGETFVGKQRLARDAGFRSVRTVDSAINRVENIGFRNIIRSKGGRPNYYIACTPHATAGSHAGDPASRRPTPRTQTAGTPHRAAPESDEIAKAGARDQRDRAAPRIIDNCVACGDPFEGDGDEPYCPTHRPS